MSQEPQPPDVIKEVLALIERLYSRPTIDYGLNHSQFEAWIAIEALELFASRGWGCWETLAFVSMQPTRPQKHRKIQGVDSKFIDRGGGLKYSDLVITNGTVSIWWEFKTVSYLTLNADPRGGTLVKDIAAFSACDSNATNRYIRDENCRDGRTISASKIREQLTAARCNVGVALCFLPSESEVACPANATRTWSPAKVKQEICKGVQDGVKRAIDISGEIAKKVVRPPVDSAPTPGPRGSPPQARAPECIGWIVPMGEP